jgi:indole-3-glycerol phosphate synthase
MILNKILAHKVVEVATAKERVPLADLEAKISISAAARGFEAALRRRSQVGTAIIAEVKKGSPSKGIIRPDFDPLLIARGYEDAGATCLSVLTDEQFFFGHLSYLPDIAAQVDLPLLRKDFIIDAYQIYEARANSADAILLIAAALDLAQLQAFHGLAQQLGLDVLLEVHNAQELELALQTSCTLIGINNRCLKTFTTDIHISEQLLQHMPADKLVVSESGIHSRADIQRLQSAGAGAFLIGESLMRESDFGAKLRELRGEACASA